MALRYRIVFTWPDGKTRYSAGERNTPDESLAKPYTLIEARDIVKRRFRDARLVWGIRTTKERIL